MHSPEHPQDNGFFVETKTINIETINYVLIKADIIDEEIEVTKTCVTYTYEEQITMRYIGCDGDKSNKLNTILSIIASLLTIGSMIVGMLIASGYTI